MSEVFTPGKPLPIRDLSLRHEAESYITPDGTIMYDAKDCKYYANVKVCGRLPNGALIVEC